MTVSAYLNFNCTGCQFYDCFEAIIVSMNFMSIYLEEEITLRVIHILLISKQSKFFNFPCHNINSLVGPRSQYVKALAFDSKKLHKGQHREIKILMFNML